MATEPVVSPVESTPVADATFKEACQYWGYLIKDDKCGTAQLDRLLRGIARVISKQSGPGDSPDLTPSQIANFYRSVGGDYDVLFLETPPASISFIYRSLGAFHSLQPAPNDDGYSTPTIPALKPRGFVTWQTIQILLGPEEHVPFLQKAVAQFDVLDPETNTLFPKILPKECFPEKPDDAMEEWYQGVAERLRKDAEEDVSDKEHGPQVRVDVNEPRGRDSSDLSGEGSADERHGAAKYFEDPLYRRTRPRPPVMRHFSKPPKPFVEDRGRLVNSVRHMLNPFTYRRKSVPGAYDDSASDGDATPTATVPPAARHPAYKRPHAPRREGSVSSTDSDLDSNGPSSRRKSPVLRHRRSHEPPTPQRDYFPAHYEDRRVSHDVPIAAAAARKEDGPPPLYGPTKSPLFATHVAQLQANNHYDRRPAMPQRTSYRPQQAVRYSLPSASPRDVEPPYVRDRSRDHYEPVGGASRAHHHRRRSEEHPRDRDRDDAARTRSHDRVKDGWDDRDRDRARDRDRGRDREKDRDRDRDRDGRTHRYVSGVQAGVDGRRYPVEQPWR